MLANLRAEDRPAAKPLARNDPIDIGSDD